MTEKSEANLPMLAPEARMSDDDWPGVVAGPVGLIPRRVVVNAAGTRYAVQRSGPGPDGEIRWAGRSYRTLAKALEACPTDALREACNGLPDDPAQALPSLQAARGKLLSVIAATDWRRGDYFRVMRCDANVRIVVDPTGSEYRVQYQTAQDYDAGKPDGWRTCASGAKLSTVLARLDEVVYLRGEPHAPTVEHCEALGAGLPELPRDGHWPALPDLE